jgi:hypothetical protein
VRCLRLGFWFRTVAACSASFLSQFLFVSLVVASIVTVGLGRVYVFIFTRVVSLALANSNFFGGICGLREYFWSSRLSARFAAVFGGGR